MSPLGSGTAAGGVSFVAANGVAFGGTASEVVAVAVGFLFQVWDLGLGQFYRSALLAKPPIA